MTTSSAVHTCTCAVTPVPGPAAIETGSGGGAVRRDRLVLTVDPDVRRDGGGGHDAAGVVLDVEADLAGSQSISRVALPRSIRPKVGPSSTAPAIEPVTPFPNWKTAESMPSSSAFSASGRWAREASPR